MKPLMMLCVVFVSILIAINSYAFTNHDFVVKKTPNTYFLDSFFPEDDHFNYALVCYTRENGKWCNNPIAAGELTCDLDQKKADVILEKIQQLKRVIDKVLLPHYLVSFSYIICYSEAVIYINDNKIPDNKKEQSYRDLCDRLNHWRNKNRTPKITQE